MTVREGTGPPAPEVQELGVAVARAVMADPLAFARLAASTMGWWLAEGPPDGDVRLRHLTGLVHAARELVSQVPAQVTTAAAVAASGETTQEGLAAALALSWEQARAGHWDWDARDQLFDE